VHLTGTCLCCRTAIAGIVTHDYGRIVNISSDAGKEGAPRMPDYSATKAGIIGLMRALGRVFTKTDVRVNCITLTMVDTDLGRYVTRAVKDYNLARVPVGRFGRPEEIAAMAAWLASEDCSFIFLSDCPVESVPGGAGRRMSAARHQRRQLRRLQGHTEERRCGDAGHH
jgi:3-oxoacyl-[acyl-carrier protein] reductase